MLKDQSGNLINPEDIVPQVICDNDSLGKTEALIKQMARRQGSRNAFARNLSLEWFHKVF